MLTRNLWIKKGLCSSAMDIVKAIIYKDGQFPPVLPVAVLIDFENFSGPTNNGCVPIIPVVSGATTSERHQLPLKLCWGLTIHKSQGLTLPNAIIDIGVKESVTGLSYVAIELTTLDRPNAIRKTKSRGGKEV